jgi:DNA-binding LacI/PurR family transcriptional regulator
MPAADIAEFAPRIATVVAGRPELHPALSSVYCDETDGGATIADTVANAGHTTVVVLTVPLDNAITQHARSSAMVERLRSRGVRVIDIDASFVRTADALAADVVDAVAESGASAVMCPTDRLMLDVCDALSKRGVRVPADVSVTGFDGVYPLANDWIGFTTLEQPIERIGREAIDLVIGRIDDPARPVEHRSLRGTVIPGRTLLRR